MNMQQSCNVAENENVKKLLQENKSWSDMWLQYDLNHIPYDENFRKVALFLMNNMII
ncbi:hypothetical protein J5751_07545 [bacterium]|nr:hypothetical protein [bacterium]